MEDKEERSKKCMMEAIKFLNDSIKRSKHAKAWEELEFVRVSLVRIKANEESQKQQLAIQSLIDYIMELQGKY